MMNKDLDYLTLEIFGLDLETLLSKHTVTSEDLSFIGKDMSVAHMGDNGGLIVRCGAKGEEIYAPGTWGRVKNTRYYKNEEGR